VGTLFGGNLIHSSRLDRCQCNWLGRASWLVFTLLEASGPSLRQSPSPIAGTRSLWVHEPSWRKDKRSFSEREYGSEWQKARLTFLDDNPVCERCEANAS
jgi:hypothetical protein